MNVPKVTQPASDRALIVQVKAMHGDYAMYKILILRIKM